MATSGYRGRFAPSPTGPLHFGSLVAALGSFLDARHRDGEWLLRVEDIDPPRESAGATQQFLHSLRCHGLHWDGPATYQSRLSQRYEHFLALLAETGHLFPCSCTRAILGPGGTCGRRCTPAAEDIVAVRVELHGSAAFDDFIIGPQTVVVPSDQVLKRKDGLYAYALAVVVDDYEQGITHVLRGRDLMDQTTAQIALHERLGNTPPGFGHIPLVLDRHGTKLSKQTGADAIDDERPLDNLQLALRYLGQVVEDQDSVSAQLSAATASWNRAAAAAELTLRYPPETLS